MIYIDGDNNLNLSKLHQSQKNFIASDVLHSGIVGGYQSGKSLAAVIKCVTKQLRDPGVPLAYYLPTYGLIDDMLVPKFSEVFDIMKTKFTYHKFDSKIITPYGEIWMRSMDNPDRIVSYSVGYSLVDEVDVVHPNKRIDAIKRISSRNSYKKSTKNCIDFVSTPEGFAFMWKFFVKQNNKNKALFELDTLDNADNLGEGYIDGLKEMYTEQQLNAYLHGKFVNLVSSNVYYSFNRYKNHSDEVLKELEPLYIGMDFNIGNMSAVTHIKRNVPIAVDEILHVYDTAQMCNRIRELYPKNQIFIYPDASGKSRKTSADATDIQIIERSGFFVRAHASNPPVSDRVKNMNRMFCDGNNQLNYLVNTNKCPEYTEALEKMPNDKNGVPDKTSGFDHVTEAGGYFIYYDYPLKKHLGFNYQ